MKRLNLDVKHANGTEYKLIFKDSGEQISLATSTGIRVLNTILRRAMDGLKMKLVQRNLYDPGNAIDIRDFRLQLWPGKRRSVKNLLNTFQFTVHFVILRIHN